jgi:sporulation protein YlmC with PRC-barrel domain
MDETLDLARTLLDRLIVDIKGEPLGRVDDVELATTEAGQPPRITGLLCGPLALGPRLSRKWGDVWAGIGRRIRGRNTDEPVRIAWALIKDVRPGEIQLAITAAEAPTLALEQWAREHIIELIPGHSEG